MPIRLTQPYSGPEYGIHFPNHAGTEMLLGHVNGNPDRPVGLGTMPNPSNVSPSVKANREQSVIKSAGQNYLIFDDTEESEQIILNGTKDCNVTIANDRNTTIGANDTLTVTADRTGTVEGNDTLSVAGDRAITITKTRTLDVTEDDAETYQAKRTITVGADDVESYGANRTVDISSNEDKTVGGNESVTVSGNCTLQVSGKVVINGDGNVEISGPSIKLTGQQEIALTVGPSSIKLSPAGIEISGPKITSSAQAINEIMGATIKLN